MPVRRAHLIDNSQMPIYTGFPLQDAQSLEHFSFVGFSMRVAVDIRWLQEAVKNRALGGVGRYALNLVTHLHGRVELVVLASPRLPLPEQLAGPVQDREVEIRAVPNCWRLPGRGYSLAAGLAVARDSVTLRRAVRSADVDLLHLPHQLSPPPRGLPCPSVVTVHDLAFLRYPRLFFGTETPPWPYRHRLRGLGRATSLLAVSQTTAHDIVALLHVPPRKVTVIYEAPEPVFTASGVGPPMEGEYFLHVGGAGPSKNLGTLLDAVAILERFDATVPRLVVVGVRSGQITHHVPPNVVELPYIGDEELAAYYRGAIALVFPSLVEGFGLPILEAMSCGTPVITSAGTAAAEVAGDAALFVADPTSARELADLMVRVLENVELREELSRKGLERAASFNWERTLEHTLDLYRRTLEECRSTRTSRR